MTDLITQLCAELAESIGEREALRDEMGALQGEYDHALTRLSEVWELTSTGTAGAAHGSLCDRVTEDVDAIAEALGADGTQWHDLGDVKRLAEEAFEREPAAREALRRYLVSIGLPADPVRLDDPNLWALYEALTPG